MKSIAIILVTIISLSLTNDKSIISYRIDLKVPDQFNHGTATLILAESNRDTLRAPIVNGYAKFTGTRTLDTTWAFVTFKQEDLYGEMPCLVFGNQITLTAEPIETYKYIPEEKEYQELDHINALHSVLASSRNRKSDWNRQATIHQRDERKKDSILGLISQQKKADNQAVLAFARNHPQETYVLQLLTAFSNYYYLTLRPDNIEQLKQVYAGLDENLKRTKTGQLLGSNIERFNSISEGGYFPKFALPLDQDRIYPLPNKEKTYPLLHFWGSWCGPCIRHIPAWNALTRKYANADIAFVNIAINDKQKEWQKAIEKYKVAGVNGIDYQDTTQSITRKTIISYVPQYVLINNEGKVIFNQYARNADEQFKALDSIFQKLNLRTLGL
jgi:thiol-disulfide isomerase/thioredoxin